MDAEIFVLKQPDLTLISVREDDGSQASIIVNDRELKVLVDKLVALRQAEPGRQARTSHRH